MTKPATPAPAVSLGDAAVNYSTTLYKWKVFQLKPRSKQPLDGSEGFYEATDSEAKHREDWRKIPDGNIGLRTGEENDIFVIDIDIVKDDGEQTLRELEAVYGALPPTITSISGSGGRHLIFRYPKGLDFKVPAKLAKGIDIKSDGGYIVAPPSIHPATGRPYQWAEGRGPGEIELAEVPAWVINLLRERREQKPAPKPKQDQGKEEEKPREKRSSSDARDTFLFAAFEAAGLLKPGGPGSVGQRNVVCPWNHEHTPGEDSPSSTVIFPAEPPHTFGKFHCSHSHCAEIRTPAHLLRVLPQHALEEARKKFPPPSPGAPTRMTPKGHLTLVASEEAPSENDEPQGPNWPWSDELIDTFEADPLRLKTGIDPIDQGWRGGARMGRLWAIGGAPGAGKTTFATQLAHDWIRQSIPVFFIASDESREGILIRIGQQIGLNRDHLEIWKPEERQALKKHLASLPFKLLDPDEQPDANVLSVAAHLRQHCPEGPAVLILDSVQTMAAFIPDALAEGMRAKVDYVLKQCKAAAKKYKMFIVALTELSRAAYKFKGESQVEDIAAGKESGGIEYTVNELTIIRSVPKSESNGEGLVVCTMPKSRLGRVDKFALRQCFQTARFALDELPDDLGGSSYQGPKESATSLEQAIVACVHSFAMDGLDTPALMGRIQRRGQCVYAALKRLQAEGLLVNKGHPNRPRWYPGVPDSPTKEPVPSDQK